MKGYIVAYFVIIVLMFVSAYTLYEWDGIWIVIGVLSGLGFWVSYEIWSRKKGKKK